MKDIFVHVWPDLKYAADAFVSVSLTCGGLRVSQ